MKILGNAQISIEFEIILVSDSIDDTSPVPLENGEHVVFVLS